MLLAFLKNLVTVGMTIEEQIYNIFYLHRSAFRLLFPLFLVQRSYLQLLVGLDELNLDSKLCQVKHYQFQCLLWDVAC